MFSQIRMSRFLPAFINFFVALLAASAAATSHAQEEEVPTTPPPATVENVLPTGEVQPPNEGSFTVDKAGNLIPASQALTRLRYDVKARGPLLVVAPDLRAIRSRARDVPSFTSSKDGYSLSQMADEFDRRIVPLKTITVLAPARMTIWNENPQGGDMLAQMQRGEKMQLLLTLLTPAQRSQMAQDGISAGDLTKEQQPLFTSLLPKNLERSVYRKNPTNGEIEIGESQPIPDAQVQRARLRLVRRASYSAKAEGDNPGDYGIYTSAVEPAAGESQLNDREENDRWDRDDAFGVWLRKDVPSRLKIGHLNFNADALAVPVSLVGAKTLGDLAARVAEAAKVDVRVDARAAGLPVFTLGDSARAGDLLKAMAWGVSGAWRKVGDRTYLLTDDVKGIGQRLARMAAWSGTMQMQNQAQQMKWRKKLAGMPTEQIRFADDDPSAPPANLRKDDAREQEVAIADLPDALRERLEAGIKTLTNGVTEGGSGIKLKTDKIRIYTTVSVQLEIPGVGTFGSAQGLNGYQVDLSTFDKANARDGMNPPPEILEEMEKKGRGVVARLKKLKARAAVLAPATPEQARLCVTRAAGLGLNQIWLRVPSDINAATQMLTAAIEAARPRGMAVFAVVSALAVDAPPSLSSSAPNAPESETAKTLANADRNVMGETSVQAYRRLSEAIESMEDKDVAAMSSMAYVFGDPNRLWLRPDKPESQIAARKRIAAIAGIPGLASVVVRDGAPPGYRISDTTGGINIMGSVGFEYGYTAEQRWAFTQKENVDPIDLITSAFGVDRVRVSFPFFEANDGEFAKKWGEMRARRADQFLAHLYVATKEAAPKMPLLLSRNDGMMGDFVALVARWNTPTMAASVLVGGFTGDNGYEKGMAAMMQNRIPQITLPSKLPPGFDKSFLPLYVTEMLRMGGSGITGFALDMTQYSFATSLEMLTFAMPKLRTPAGAAPSPNTTAR